MAKTKTLDEALEALSAAENEIALLKTNNPNNSEELKTELEALKKENNEQAEIIAELREQLILQSKASAAKQNLVEHGGKRYKITSPSFHLNGRKYFSDELLENESLVESLITMGAGILEEIND